jgi:hypothetical protein
LNFDHWFEKLACEPDPSRPKVSGMRHAKNFHPEWGFLAPAPSFMRTLRTVFVATAVGATAGGGLVLSLVDHSAGQTSVAERTLVRPIPTASTSVGAPQIARLNPPAINQSESPQVSGVDGHASGGFATSEADAGSSLRPAVAFAEVRTATDNTSAKTAAAPSPAVQTRVMRVAQQSARQKDIVSLSHRNIQHTAQYPETSPQAPNVFNMDQPPRPPMDIPNH